ncbi:MAG TPA: hypothetical protein VFG71_10910 [Nitrospiraceae bacterium]|nr:hypothetical protein [Nitrospiraceae bacterium]
MRPHIAVAFIALMLLIISAPLQASAEDKAYYSPVIHVDKENNRILISTLGSVFWVEVPDAAKPHLDTLPVSGLADFVVEMRPGQAPLLKTWKFASGDTPCKYFDGQNCR